MSEGPMLKFHEMLELMPTQKRKTLIEQRETIITQEQLKYAG